MGKSKTVVKNGAPGPVYGLGFIGGAIYFIKVATTFWGGVAGFFKAIVWPVFVIYFLLQHLHLH